MHHHDRQILRIALPAIVTNITVPLLGLVDTAIVGHMGAATYIGAVAVGSMIFNLIYWIFGFLRMGTSGMTAQARGRRDMQQTVHLLRHSAVVASAVALLLILLQWPLCKLMMWFIGPTPDVRPLAATYFYIVVWGAPASLGLFALTGWFIGMQNTRSPMVISILQNVINIVASLLLVFVLGMKVEGVALGTVIAQYAGLLTGLALLRRYYGKLFSHNTPPSTVPVGSPDGGCPHPPSTVPVGSPDGSHHSPVTSGLRAFLQVNRDIFLRTLFLVAVNLYFTSAGARQGAVILAVNTLLMQLYLLFSYVMDGFAYAGEALGGRYWGAKNHVSYRDVIRRLFVWGAGMTLLFTLLYLGGGTSFLRLLTNDTAVITASHDYLWWAWLIPAAGVAAFIWDGIFIGTTQTRGMLLSSFIAATVFFVMVFTLTPYYGNHALWLAMLLFLLMRGCVQTVLHFRSLP